LAFCFWLGIYFKQRFNYFLLIVKKRQEVIHGFGLFDIALQQEQM